MTDENDSQAHSQPYLYPVSIDFKQFIEFPQNKISYAATFKMTPRFESAK